MVDKSNSPVYKFTPTEIISCKSISFLIRIFLPTTLVSFLYSDEMSYSSTSQYLLVPGG